MYECPVEAKKAFTMLRQAGSSRRRAMAAMGASRDWFLKVQHAQFDKLRCASSLRVSDGGLACSNVHLGDSLVSLTALTEPFVIGENLPFLMSLRVEVASNEPAICFGLVPRESYPGNPDEDLMFGLNCADDQKFAPFAAIVSDGRAIGAAESHWRGKALSEHQWAVEGGGVTHVRLLINPLSQRMVLEGNSNAITLDAMGFEPGTEVLLVLQLAAGRNDTHHDFRDHHRVDEHAEPVARKGKERARRLMAEHSATAEAARAKEGAAREVAAGWVKKHEAAEELRVEAEMNTARLFEKGWDKAAREQEVVQRAQEALLQEADQERQKFDDEAAKHARDAERAEAALAEASPWATPLSAVQIESSLDNTLVTPYAEMTSLGRTRRTSFSEEFVLEMG
jgi:hypothetical protein